MASATAVTAASPICRCVCVMAPRYALCKHGPRCDRTGKEGRRFGHGSNHARAIVLGKADIHGLPEAALMAASRDAGGGFCAASLVMLEAHAAPPLA